MMPTEDAAPGVRPPEDALHKLSTTAATTTRNAPGVGAGTVCTGCPRLEGTQTALALFSRHVVCTTIALFSCAALQSYLTYSVLVVDEVGC